MSLRPLVFVAMPFGTKPDAARTVMIDFDAIYERAIKPALARFDVVALRADEERSGGVIHLPMFERLLLAEVAVVDVTIDNANVFYELGVRHAARPQTTIITSGKEGALPFDIAMLRAIPYRLAGGVLSPESAAAFSDALAARLGEALARSAGADSPLFQLIPGFPGITLPRDYQSTFRDRADELRRLRERLEAARLLAGTARTEAIAALERDLGTIGEDDLEAALDVLAAYRDAGAFDALIALVERILPALRRPNVALNQLHAFALNRRNAGHDRERAIGVLEGIIASDGISSETAGLMARIFKERFEEARSGDPFLAAGYLQHAIEWYRRGFSSDPREYYPGVNLCTLLTIDGSDEALAELRLTVPVVAFAVARLGGLASTDYWIVASAFELAVLRSDWALASRALSRMRTLAGAQPWMLQSTAKNLALLRAAAPASIDAKNLEAVARSLAG
ncbi:MAG: hypothetical protein QOF71_952 [Candidatus Eremiobacteraeota bacterium]|nr:hypothetical protein [Candidatus Eremiobacteraeota bacterium]